MKDDPEDMLFEKSIGYQGLEIDDIPVTVDIPDKIIEVEKPPVRRNVICTKRNDRNIYRRAFSETQLLDVLGFDFKEGESYHTISAGDVDILSFLKCVLRQQNLKHCLFSTWCMAQDDILQIEDWLKTGKIKTMDAYVGEIFKGSYLAEYDLLKPIIKRYKGRFIIFRNHSKIISGYGDKFYFAVESSANINTNPRTENSCLTIAKGIYEFYKDYFDGIISFEKDGR